MADALDYREEVLEPLPCFARRREADMTLAEFSTGDDFGLQFVMISEEEVLADRNFSAGPNEALPVLRIGLQLAREEDFDASAKEVARCWIVWTENLRLKASAAAIQAGGKHSSVVEDDEVVGSNEIREITEMTIFTCAAC